MKNKVIIFKKPDLGIIQLYVNEKKFGEGKRDFKEDPIFQKYIKMGYDYFVTDVKNIPSKKGIESRKQLYHDGDKIKVDSKWEHRLMPDQLIKKKHIDRLNSKLDNHLSGKNPDTIEVLRIHREIDKHKSIKAGPQNEDTHWLNIAHQNLDENVKNGHNDKNNIRKLLNEKISEIKNLKTKE